MTCGDLFAGIGGMSLGLQRAGFVVRWQVEADPYCETILERHWPLIPRRRDVRFAGVATLAPVDLIAGGFPCQDVSAAGKGAGLTGHRSGLWREFARIVSELSPRWVLVENVPALRRRGADIVLGDLEAAGYACWPLVVGARHVGARTDATGFGSSAEWMTPRAWPTATQRDWKDGACLDANVLTNGLLGRAVVRTDGKPRARLNPRWVAQLMGYPPDWLAPGGGTS